MRAGKVRYLGASNFSAERLMEARVLGYACDLLLPAHALAIEAIGGVHALTTERDALRLAALHDQGLTVLAFSNEALYRGEADRLFTQLLEVRHAA